MILDTTVRQKAEQPKDKLLYRNEFEHDNCGIGAVVNIKGVPSHTTVDNALTIVETLEHRAGKDAQGKTGDGVGILLQISDRFFQKAAKALNIPIGSKRDYAVGMFFFPQNELELFFRLKRIISHLFQAKFLYSPLKRKTFSSYPTRKVALFQMAGHLFHRTNRYTLQLY